MKGGRSFNYERLATAIATRDHSYRLLLWIADAIDKQQIPHTHAAHHSGGPEAARDWLRSCYHGIPEQLRPAENVIDEFAAFFSTYLTSSFDVVEAPGNKGGGPIPRLGCGCDVCARIVNAPHLKAKKLRASDKHRAEWLMLEGIRALAIEIGVEVGESQAVQIVAHQATRRAAAYWTYGHWLIRRLDGESDGPAILALWRLIAWDPRGGMRRGFVLRLDNFRRAEKLLTARLRDSALR